MDNIFYQINRRLSSTYKKLRVQNINYNEIENICEENNMLKKRYWYFFSIFVYPAGKPMIPHLLRCQEFAVNCYGFTLERLESGASSTFTQLGCNFEP